MSKGDLGLATGEGSLTKDDTIPCFSLDLLESSLVLVHLVPVITGVEMV